MTAKIFLVLGTAGMAWIDGGLSTLIVGTAIAYGGSKVIRHKMNTINQAVSADQRKSLENALRDQTLSEAERYHLERNLEALEEGVAASPSKLADLAGGCVAAGALVNPVAGAAVLTAMLFKRK